MGEKRSVMKKLIVLVALIMIPAVSMAAATITTGNVKLDKYLNALNAEVASGKLTVAELKAHVQQSFGLKARDHAFMEKKGLLPAEHYLVGLIHKGTKASVQRIVRLRRSGKRKWSDVIYYLGATPDELNAERVADTRKWKKGRVRGTSKASSKRSTTVVPPSGEKVMTMKEDGKVWDCRCRLKSRRRK